VNVYCRADAHYVACRHLRHLNLRKKGPNWRVTAPVGLMPIPHGGSIPHNKSIACLSPMQRKNPAVVCDPPGRRQATNNWRKWISRAAGNLCERVLGNEPSAARARRLNTRDTTVTSPLSERVDRYAVMCGRFFRRSELRYARFPIRIRAMGLSSYAVGHVYKHTTITSWRAIRQNRHKGG
jgi:hypothetical protein